MLYNTLEFGVFYVLVFLLYWFVANRNLRIQNLLLLGASYFFYAWWDWRFLSLVILSSLTDFLSGQKIADANTPQRKKLWLIISLAINLGLLGFFKYYGFFVDSFIDLFHNLGYDMPGRTLRIILPVGISFYTFQTMSYSLDIYNGKIKPSRDLISFLAFVSFFPQLIAGPIERASNFLPQFSKVRKFKLDKARDGMRQILWGLFKKVVVADTLGEYVGWIIESPDNYSGIVLLMGVFFFAFQLYGDFSGYSDIAIGTAKLLGFNLMRNFNYPFFARDIMDFWRRWHISLTTWFRDYVFVNLSGGKLLQDKWLNIRNFTITFAISGLWHGANWTYVVWGVLHGLYHIPYILNPKLRTNIQATRAPYTFIGTLKAFLQAGITWAMNLFALVFFMSPTIQYAFEYLQKIASPSLFQAPEQFKRVLIWVVLFMFAEWWQMQQKAKHPLEIGSWPALVRWTVYYGIALVIMYFNYERRAFIYFQF